MPSIEGLEQWFLQHPFVGILLMALAAGLLAHVRKVAQEFPINGDEFRLRDYVKWSVRCTGGFILRMTSAGVGALFVLWAWRGFGSDWRVEHAFLASGIVGMFSTEVFEFAFNAGKAWVLKRLGLAPSDLGKIRRRR